MSPASRAPLIKTGMVSQGSQSLALGLAKTAASQLDEFVRSRALAFWAKPGTANPTPNPSPFTGRGTKTKLTFLCNLLASSTVQNALAQARMS